ncbi:MAG: AI-2E family transporter [Cyclobacteriaceae bacterium]|nr:AI-2E family transporter [Cyclobacteriaceae bacterium]
MDAPDKPSSKQANSSLVIHHAIRLGALGILIFWCFNILSPFVIPIIWGYVFASTFSPLHNYFTDRFKLKEALSATLITLLALAVLVVPAVFFIIQGAGEISELAAHLDNNDLYIPPPAEKIKTWPIIGEKVYEFWHDASVNLTATLQDHQDRLKPILGRLLQILRNTATGILLILISIIISGVLLAYEKEESGFFRRVLIKLTGQKTGEKMAGVARRTIQNVVKGILGVAAIQSLVIGIGLFIFKVPLAGLWIVISLILAIIQIGPLPVVLGVIIYAWSNLDSGPAIILTVWMVVSGLIDNVLKPILLGKGATVPMLVVFLGAIGGFIYSGFLGLFTGSIVLTLGYELLVTWMNSED